MTPQRFESEELDSDSLEYLKTVRDHEGRGAPGVFLDERVAGLSGSGWPLWGLFIGIALLLFTLLVVWLAILHDPFNVALLATGLGFLGAWLVVAWLRCLLARRRADYLGYFKYFDPHYLWHATGRAVLVTPLAGLVDARRRREPASTLRVVLEEGAFDVLVRDADLAEGLEVYLSELARGGPGLPLERGYRAVAAAGFDDDEPLVESLPEPQRARRSLGWLRYPVVLLLFGLTFLAAYQVCKNWREASFYSAVNGQGPPELRAYLADPRNTRHRDDVQRQLDAFHDQTAAQIDKLADQPGEPELCKGLASLVRALKTSPAPVLTIGVARSPQREEGTLEAILGPRATPVMASTMVKALSTRLTEQMKAWRGPQVGEQLVAFGEALEGRFAMIRIEPRLRPVLGGGGLHNLVWTVTLQADESAPKFTCRWKEGLLANSSDDLKKQLQDACNRFPGKFMDLLLRTKVRPDEQP